MGVEADTRLWGSSATVTPKTIVTDNVLRNSGPLSCTFVLLPSNLWVKDDDTDGLPFTTGGFS